MRKIDVARDFLASCILIPDEHNRLEEKYLDEFQLHNKCIPFINLIEMDRFTSAFSFKIKLIYCSYMYSLSFCHFGLPLPSGLALVRTGLLNLFLNLLMFYNGYGNKKNATLQCDHQYVNCAYQQFPGSRMVVHKGFVYIGAKLKAISLPDRIIENQI